MQKNKNNFIQKEETQIENPALLGTSLIFTGELSGNENLVIEGQFQGSIHLYNSDLIIASSGKVKGEIRARNVTIKGKVEGPVFSSGKILIDEEGILVGNITASRVSIQEGAQFKGSVKMHSPAT